MDGTSLHKAAEEGDLKLLRKLLEAGAAVNAYDESGYTPLLKAVASPKADAETVKFLLKKGADDRLTVRVSFPNGEAYRHHALSLSIHRLNLAKARLFIDAGADIRYVREGGYDALLDAAFFELSGPTDGQGNAERLKSMIEFLLARGVTLSGRTQKGQTALTALSGRLELNAVRQLIDAGADETQLKWTPLHKAVAFGTAKDVALRLDQGDPLESKDHGDRTPLVLAALKGEIEKVEILWKRGAARNATWGMQFNLLQTAIFQGDSKLLSWLIANGADVNQTSGSFSPLYSAVMQPDPFAVKALLAAGADVHWRSEHGATALNAASDREMIRLLLDAGADTGTLSNEGRRVLMGLPPDSDIGLLTASDEEYSRAKHPRQGRGNPEEAPEPFWLGMIRSGVTAYGGKKKYKDGSSPIWCAQRFGQSLTFLPDRRIILIGGEHEDFYDSDFHIYNDVFVMEPGGKLRIFLYPNNEFSPTDGHSATLVGDWIYIIGNVGYPENRREGFTPVYRLGIKSLRMEQVATTGDGPGWVGRHRAKLRGSRIEVAGGEIFKTRNGKASFEKNDRTFALDLDAMIWRPAD